MIRFLLGLNLVLWMLLAISGIAGYIGLMNQRVAGYPNGGQAYLYLLIPLEMVIATIIGMAAAKSANRTSIRVVLASWLVLSLVGILPYIVISRGGV